MALTFDDAERSSARSRPIDLFTISIPGTVFHLTSHVEDVVANVVFSGGDTFTATTFTALTMSRGPQSVAQDLTGRELLLYLPVTHPIVRRFAASGIPAREVLVTMHRLQQSVGVTLQAWQGFACGISCDAHIATIRIPSLTDDAMKVRLPTVRAQRGCNHVLYDAQCQMARTSFQMSTEVALQLGSTLLVSSMGGQPTDFASLGEVLHVASTERRFVLKQTGTTLTLNAPFVGASIGDALLIFAGCDHTQTTCKAKFNNLVNFGGTPLMNSNIKPWAPGGLGIITQQ